MRGLFEKFECRFIEGKYYRGKRWLIIKKFEGCWRICLDLSEDVWKASWRNGLLNEKYIEEFELVDLFKACEKILGERRLLIEQVYRRIWISRFIQAMQKESGVEEFKEKFEGVKRIFFERKDPGCWRICLNVDLSKRWKGFWREKNSRVLKNLRILKRISLKFIKGMWKDS